MEYVDSEIYHIVDYGGKHMGDIELLDMLNNLHEENQRLHLTLQKKNELLTDVLKVNGNLEKKIREMEDE